MVYNFHNLSPADFEDLSRDLVGKELSCRFEAFCSGPDGGIDGRHSIGRRSTILQAKHYFNSTYSSLKRAIKREVKAIIALNPHRYVLATSKGLTPKNKKELSALFSSTLRKHLRIFGREDLASLLRSFPEVEKAHIKLWLPSAAVLDRVLRAASHTFTATSRDEIEAKVKVYAQNPSFKEARDKLEKNHVVIISGPPGVGKTTLAEMLAYAYIGDDWEFVAIRNLEDGFAAIVDTKKQVFFFDDFLGKIALDARALSTKDFELARFIRRIQKSPNARFILTTRAYIFEEARRASEYLGDGRLDIMKYVLDVGAYTRRIRARILYNHLYVFRVHWNYIRALLQNNIIQEIIDHPNYNPRIIEWMTDVLNLRSISAEQYPRAFIRALDDPSQIWDKAFRSHIPSKCQNLLFALFFCSEYGVQLEDLKIAFDSLHSALCKKFGQPQNAKDFEEALKILEGSFIKIADTSVSFINPSVRDYLSGYLNDPVLLSIFAPTSQSVRWARSVWERYKQIETTSEDKAKFARRYTRVAARFRKYPVWKKSSTDPSMLRYFDDSNAERINLLLEWWRYSQESDFADAAIAIASNPVEGFSAWMDGDDLVEIIISLHSGDYENLESAEELISHLENRLVGILDSGIGPDDLMTIVESVDSSRIHFSQNVFDAINRAIDYALDEADFFSSQYGSESIIDDQAKATRALAKRQNISGNRLRKILAIYKARKAAINDDVQEEKPSFSGKTSGGTDNFDDYELRALFESLLIK